MKGLPRKIKKYRAEISIFSFFILLSLVITFPLIFFRIKSSFYGYPSDFLGGIWQLWWLKCAIWQKHISPNFCPLLAAPFGIDLTSIMAHNIFSNYFMRLPLLFLNEIVVHNLTLLLTFFLSAITMYFLVYHFIKNKQVSMVSGIIYAFSPYHLTHAQQHFGLAQIQWMPLYILLLFKLDKNRTYKYALLCALAFSLNLFSDIHYGYFMLIFTATFVAWRMWQGLRERRAGEKVSRWTRDEGRGRKSIVNSQKSIVTDYSAPEGRDLASGGRSLLKTVKVVLVAIIIAAAIILPLTYHPFRNIFTTPERYARPIRDLFSNSARPLGYLLPSQDNPFFGKFTKKFIDSPFYGGHPVEHTLYLGWVGIVLSIVAIQNWRRKNKLVNKLTSKQVNKETQKQNINNRLTGQLANWSTKSQKAVSFFLFAGIVALIFSHSPYTEIGNFRILFPSYFMYKVLPMFRVYARFGIVVMLCVSVLAGISLASILEKIKNTKKRKIFLTIILLLIFIEFAPTLPAPMVNAVNPPPVYEWLTKQEGDFIIVEYPLENDQEYQFWQRIHQKRLVNGAQSRTYADKVRREIVDILKPETPGILKYLGAKYIILHPDKYLKSEDVPIIGEVPNPKGQSGLKLIKVFDEIEVYEVTAQPIEPTLKD